MPRKLLVVDDEPSIVKGLRFTLTQDGYEVDVAYDGQEALDKFAQNTYDLIVLDVMLPGVDGLRVCQNIRENSSVPIIMLTAKGEDMDKILGLEYGADDYVTKPFNILELKARIKTVLRRAAATHAAAPVQEKRISQIGDLCVNAENRSVFIGEKEINGEGVRPSVSFHLQPGKSVQPRKSSGNDLEIRLSWRPAHRRRAYPPPARKGRKRSESSPLYPHQMGGRLLFC